MRKLWKTKKNSKNSLLPSARKLEVSFGTLFYPDEFFWRGWYLHDGDEVIAEWSWHENLWSKVTMKEGMVFSNHGAFSSYHDMKVAEGKNPELFKIVAERYTGELPVNDEDDWDKPLSKEDIEFFDELFGKNSNK